MNNFLNKLINDNKHWTKKGKVATYIPELSKADTNTLGISIYDINNDQYSAGNYNTKFTIQSVSKVIILLCALIDQGNNKVFSKVGMKATTYDFNSLIKLEVVKNHKPLNPFINAGAITTLSLVNGTDCEDKFRRVFSFIKKLCNNNSITINEYVYNSEKLTGDTNRAIAYYLKSTRIIQNNVENLLDAYFRLCAVELTVKDVARLGAVLANKGSCPWNNNRLISERNTQIVKALMTTCGLYNESGDFSVKVGLPAKSGVGGCILAVSPNNMGIGTIGPALNTNGNSLAGIKLLEALSLKLNLNMF